MDRAWVHAIGRDMTVEEFLKLKGDSGYLIGKNLITCIECKANVKFVAASPRAKAYFSHVKFKETNKSCELRVNSYTPEKVRLIRKRESKYRVGYFQQRFEDYVSLCLIDLFKKSNLHVPVYLIDEKRNKKHIIQLKRLESKEDENIFVKYMRSFRKIEIDSVPAFKQFFENWMLLLKTWSENEDWFYEEPLFNILTSSDRKYDTIEKLKREISPFEEKQIKDYLIHLSRKGTEDESICLLSASLILYLAVELNITREANLNKIDKNFGFVDVDSLLIDLKSIHDFNTEEKVSPEYASQIAISIYMLYELGFHDPDFEKNYLEFFDYLDNYFDKYKDEFKWEDYQQRSLDKLYHFVKTTLWNINFHDLAMEFFGDDSKSPAELRRLSIDQNRGFIYVAWSEHFKEIWKKSLEKKGLTDVVKIGYSENPDKRKDEIGGQIVPPESIFIIDKWPVADMEGAEKYIFNKLKKGRLDSRREMFGMTKEEAVSKVDLEISKWEKK